MTHWLCYNCKFSFWVQDQPISRNTSEWLLLKQFIYLSCQNMKMIAKRFSSSSAGMLLEKIIKKITECSGTKRLWGKPSCKKEFLHIYIYIYKKKELDLACIYSKTRKKKSKQYIQITKSKFKREIIKNEFINLRYWHCPLLNIVDRRTFLSWE